MKNNRFFLRAWLSILLLAGVAGSCKDEFLERPPIGTYSGPSLANAQGVEGILIGTYAALNGRTDTWYGGATNWLWGSAASDEAFKGSEASDQADANPVETFDVLPSNPAVNQKWEGTFDGIGRANEVLRMLAIAEDVLDTDRPRIEGEARFLRGHFHFEGMKMFYRIPFVDETVTDFTELTNDQPIWDQIEADFRFGYENLPATMPDVGRANKWAAASYLAKAHMYQGEYQEAKVVLDDIIANGTTSAGVKYGLNESFHDNFRIATKNSQESIFAFQSSVNEGAQGFNGNYENTLNYPHGAGDKPGGCCGFFQPSFNLVNSYKTDASGLPLLDEFNAENMIHDAALTSAEPFTPYTGSVDPRLDWTVGRRGIPFLDWGPHPGRSWIRDVTWGGPYSSKKHVHYSEDVASGYQPGTWGQPTNAMNFNIIRFADVLLWAAEAEAELGNLDQALAYVNMIRERAANPGSFVMEEDGSPAANYVIAPYPSFPTKEFALDAIRFERKLELAMEGHRHFDLVRWGIAAPVINAYLAVEQTRLSHLAGAVFNEGRDEYWPIPGPKIDQSQVDGAPTLKQTPGY